MHHRSLLEVLTESIETLNKADSLMTTPLVSDDFIGIYTEAKKACEPERELNRIRMLIVASIIRETTSIPA